MESVMKHRTFDDFVRKITRDRPGVGHEMRAQKEAARIRDALVAARKANGLTQRSLAERAAWKQPYVARLESPDFELRDCRISALEQYLGACDLKVGVVFYREDDEKISLVDAAPVDGSAFASQCFSSLLQSAPSVEPGAPHWYRANARRVAGR